MELVASSPKRILSMTEYKGRLIVATEDGVWERGPDGKFREIEFTKEPEPSDIPPYRKAEFLKHYLHPETGDSW